MSSVLLHSSTHTPLILFNATATTKIYTLSLHDALPISPPKRQPAQFQYWRFSGCVRTGPDSARSESKAGRRDRKSTRLNSSHLGISYAVFCLKKKKKKKLNKEHTHRTHE